MKPEVIVLGGGPAGLTASYELAKHGVRSVVLEKDSVVGGISRTSEYKGYLFDIGGHRFFTRVRAVEAMWQEVLGEDFLLRRRMSRIFYRRKFFQYPLEPWNALQGLGLGEALRCVVSYMWARVAPILPEKSFADWVTNRFGRRLFQIFFESYTEKVWGMPCQRIGSDWAAQRIRGLSLFSVVRNAFRPSGGEGAIKTLIRNFRYPRRGPGMMWQRTRERIEEFGSQVVMNHEVEKIFWEPGRVTGVQAGGRLFQGAHFVSSLPIRELIEKLDPVPPEQLRAEATAFQYRDFLTVALILQRDALFPDHWIYIHEPGVKVGRIQNFGNWSPEMVPEPGYSCLGMEYFCFAGDGLWTMGDADLVALARAELAHLGLAAAEEVVDGCVVRMAKAYPVYDEHYQRGIAAIREFLATVPNLQLVGRNGMHRYNNQDHSMLTAMLAARNIVAGHERYDLWKVNADAEYHEETERASTDENDFRQLAATQPLTPTAWTRE